MNTIIRRPTDGLLVGYNTDCEAGIGAIEDALTGRINDCKNFNAKEGISLLLMNDIF